MDVQVRFRVIDELLSLGILEPRATHQLMLVVLLTFHT
jgi:hypothetical protein